jgi:B-cell receptor-associated protein 31
MFRVTAESDAAKSNRNGVVSDIRTDTGIAARKF